MQANFRIGVLLALIGIVLVSVVAGSYAFRGNDDVGVNSELQLKKILNGWSFMVIEDNGMLVRDLHKVLARDNLRVSILKYNTLNDMVIDRRPQVVIVNLLDRNVLSELYSSNATISILSKLMLRGSYVLFVTNDSNTLQRISKMFNPPLSVPPSKITMTKEYKDGKKETIVQNLLIITGRTYKNINGRLVPIEIGVTVSLEDSNSNIDSIIQKALHNALISIVDDENRFSHSEG